MSALDAGLHVGVPEEEYHAHSAYARSRVSKAAVLTPAHYAASAPMTGKHLVLGTAAHCLLLDGVNAFESTYKMGTTCSATTGKGESCSRQGSVGSGEFLFCQQHAKQMGIAEGDSVVLSQDDWGQVQNMVETLLGHPIVSEIVGSTSKQSRELTAIWSEPSVSDVLCRARFDLRDGGGMLWDYKTTRSALSTPHVISTVLRQYAYHHQAGWYTRGAEVLGMEPKGFGFILQEKSAPYAIRVVRMSASDIDAGWSQMQNALASIVACERSGSWPAYPHEILDISLPDWVTDQSFTTERGEG